MTKLELYTPVLLLILLLSYWSNSSIASDPFPGKLSINSGDWPWWRGPQRNGAADAEQSPPIVWDSNTNVAWRTPIKGRGHSSPVVVADRVFLTTADSKANQQIVLCLNRETGESVWEVVVHSGGLPDPADRKHSGNEKASFASSTVACDGNAIFVNFLANKAVFTTAIDWNGQQLWQTKICDYQIHQGYGSSPAIYEDLVIVSADNKSGGRIAALDRTNGDIKWSRDRPAKPNYPSPVILHIDGKDQLLFTGCDLVTSLDPMTGTELWEIEGATTECVTSTVTDGTHIFTSGGYPKNHMSAVVADGSGKVAWENSVRTYVPSMLVKGDRLFAVLDAGVATCWNSHTGQEIWKGRLAGTFSSSPVLVNDRIYVTNEEGTTFVFSADTDNFTRLGDNKLGESVFATPVICGGRVYLRAAEMVNGNRQEYLYCIAE